MGRARRNASVVNILAKTAASAAQNPRASADANPDANVQPVPWVWAVATRGAVNQPHASGVAIQSWHRPVSGESPPVMHTLSTPNARNASAMAGKVPASSGSGRPNS